MSERAITVDISSILSPDLAIRDAAIDLFKEFEKMVGAEIEVDFSGVKFITRSFAHEYWVQKQRTKKNICETNVPTSILNMLNLVKIPREKERLPELSNLRIVSL
ncbi:MAG: DUF4325 domain-containing protein [Methanomassiliicoccales archaeon]